MQILFLFLFLFKSRTTLIIKINLVPTKHQYGTYVELKEIFARIF